MKILILFLMMLGTRVEAQVNFSFHGDADTAEFEETYGKFERGELALNKRLLSNYQIVFVQGLATNITHQIGRFLGPVISKQDGFLSPFWQQKRLLDKLGIPSQFAPINPNLGTEKNGDVIANTILEAFAFSQKKVILITQSKAGPDAITGLLNNPLVRSKLAGWLAYQPPHHGTYLADAPTNGSVSGFFIDKLFKLLQGSGLAIRDMRTDHRRRYMHRNREAIARVLTEVPVVTLVTDDVPLSSLTNYLLVPLKRQQSSVSFLAPFVHPIASHGGGINDGIAMVEGTCIEGGRSCVYLHGIDHFAAVMNTSPWKTPTERERLLIFQSLLHHLTQYLR